MSQRCALTMNESPLVSITIPCYNYAQYVGVAIQSVLDQTYTNIELIVVDNGSTDNSLEVLRSFSDKRIKVLTIEKNEGILPAWQMGFANSRGAWLALLPADDFYLKDKIAEQIRFLNEHPEIDVLGTHIITANADGVFDESDTSSFALTCNVTWNTRDLENWEWDHKLWMPSVLYRREFCDEVSRLEPGLYNVSDWEFHVRLLRRKAQVAVLPEKLTCYRWHGQNQSDSGHTGLPPILLEWVHTYARLYVPLLEELNEHPARARSVAKFLIKYAFHEQPPESCAKLVAALLFPEETIRLFPQFKEFKAFAAHDLLTARMPELLGLTQALQLLKSQSASSIEGFSQYEADILKREIRRRGEESDRRAAERDRLKQALEKKCAEVEKLRARVADREKKLSRSWFRRLWSK